MLCFENPFSERPHRSMGRSGTNWPFRSQSIDRNQFRRSVQVLMSESNTSLNNADDLPDPVRKATRNKMSRFHHDIFDLAFFKIWNLLTYKREKWPVTNIFRRERKIRIPLICSFPDFTEIRKIRHIFFKIMFIFYFDVSNIKSISRKSSDLWSLKIRWKISTKYFFFLHFKMKSDYF